MDQQHARAERIRHLAADIRATRNAEPLPGQGRGIVVVAGGARIFTNAYVLLRVLRHTLGSTLPVELWHFGAAEISPAMAALVEPLGVRLVDANPLIAATGAAIRDGWQLKSFALVHSRFAEVLLLDADQVPVTDPAACFDWPEYAETGAIFWPDMIDLRRDNAVWDLLGLPPVPGPSLESGQLLVDRRRHAAPLRAALKLNEAADDLYQLIYGDKDTYLLAWHLLGAPYAQVPHRPFSDDFVLVQRDFAGTPLFQHRTQAKWQYGGQQRQVFGFQHEAACLAALSELEARWSGRVFAAPDRTAAAREAEAALIAAGPFQLEPADAPPLALRFAPHAELTDGRAPDRRHWWIEEHDGRLQLVLTDGVQRSYLLEPGPDGIWRGRRHRHPVVGIALVPQWTGAPIATPDQPGLLDELLRAASSNPGPDLTAALHLLARVIPGTAPRLTHLATIEPDPARAAWLRTLAATLTPPPRRETVRSLKIEAHYDRPGTAR
jgi:hypothetical protein